MASQAHNHAVDTAAIAHVQSAIASIMPIERIRPWRRTMSLAYEARNARRDLFGPHILADPAWDMLLVLAIAACDEHEMTVGQACSGARASMTTALRAIDYLTDRKLIDRRPNPFDRRSILLSISEMGMTRMVSLFERSAKRVEATSEVENMTWLI